MRLLTMMIAAVVAALLGRRRLPPPRTYPKFTGLVVDAADVLPPATRGRPDREACRPCSATHKRQLVVATDSGSGGSRAR